MSKAKISFSDLITLQEFLDSLGYKSPESLRKLLARDETMPKPIKPTGRKIFFVKAEVDKWLESKVNAR